MNIDTDQLDWQRDAACQFADPELFFTTQGMSTDAAVELCNRCPVREACLDYAMEHGFEHGVWGGTTPNDRRKLFRLRGGRLQARTAA